MAPPPLRRRRRVASLLRLGYRGAWWVWQAFSLVARPRLSGVKCVLRDRDGRVLFVRHAYGDRSAWELPGGRAHRTEAPADAARREMREELGVDLERWSETGVVQISPRGARLTLTTLIAEWPAGAEVDPDPVEIAAFAWHAPAMPPEPLGDLSRIALAAVRR